MLAWRFRLCVDGECGGLRPEEYAGGTNQRYPPKATLGSAWYVNHTAATTRQLRWPLALGQQWHILDLAAFNGAAKGYNKSPKLQPVE